jgi:serine protease AprX
MRRLYTIIIVLLISIPAFSQRVAENSYWFYFTDKDNNGYSVHEPEEFLSIRSIDRRAWQSLFINETDLPVTQSYLDSLSKLNLEIKHVSKWLNGVLVISSDTELIDTLTNISFVSTDKWEHTFDETNYPEPSADRFEPALETPPSYAYGYSKKQVSQVGTEILHQAGYTGAGVYVAVIDMGFTNMPIMKAFKKTYERDLLLAERNFVDRSVDAYENHHHGTHVASIIAANWTDTLIGTAPDATLILAVTENGASETKIEEFAWIEAIEWADSLGVDIINTSLSYSQFDDPLTNYSYEDMNGYTAFSSRVASWSAHKGLLNVVSAGNAGNNAWHYIAAPADASNTISVGAVDSMGNIASFSSRGPTYDHRIKPEIVARGVLNAVSTVYDLVAFVNGTSYSSPIISGSAACLWQAFPSLPASKLMRVIFESSDLRWTPDIIYGYGTPNFGRALQLVSAAPTSLLSQDLKAYPNPFHEVLYIELPIEDCGEYQITIYDLQGRTVHSSQESIPVQIELARDTPSGIYIIELKNREQSFRSRLIKY